MRSWRNAAMKVIVFQRPCGTMALSLRPRGAHPLSGAMLVLVQVSSMKTRRSGAIRSWYFVHCARRRAMSGRSRSPATTLFFKAQLLVMHEGPHRAVIHLQAALGELGYQPAQGEVPLPNPSQQPDAVLARNRPWLVTPNLACSDATSLPQASHPPDRGADANAKLLCSLVTGQTAGLNRSHHPFTKINGIGSTHWMLASFPASILNQNPDDSGIPNRFRIKPSRFSAGHPRLACSAKKTWMAGTSPAMTTDRSVKREFF